MGFEECNGFGGFWGRSKIASVLSVWLTSASRQHTLCTVFFYQMVKIVSKVSKFNSTLFNLKEKCSVLNNEMLYQLLLKYIRS